MNRHQYRHARRMLRDNGLSALRWMSPDHADTMRTLGQQTSDPLGHLAWVLASFGQTGMHLELRYRRDVKRQSLTFRAPQSDNSCH